MVSAAGYLLVVVGSGESSAEESSFLGAAGVVSAGCGSQSCYSGEAAYGYGV